MSEDATLDKFVDTEEKKNEDKNRITGFGTFPSEWDKKNIVQCAKIRDSERIPLNSQEREEKKPGEIPYYGANGVLDYINEYIFDSELILLAEDGGHFEEYQERPIAYRISDKAWVNNHAHILEAKEGTVTDYLFYSLEHRNLVPYVSGSTRSKLTQSMLKKVKIPLPTLEEQRKIATVLHNVDQAIQKTEEIIEQTKTLEQALKDRLLSKGLENRETTKTRLGPVSTEIPVNWEKEKIGELFVDRQLGTAERGSIEDGENIDLIKMGNINFGTWDLSEVEKIEKDSQLLEEAGLQHGDLLFNTRNTPELVGKTAVWEFDNQAIYDNNLLRLRFGERVSSGHFVNAYLSSNIGRRQLRSRVHGTTSVAAIYWTDLQQVEIPVPPKKEQEEIVEILRAVDKTRKSNESYQSRLKRVKRGLMQDLLSGTVRTTDTNIEIPDEIAQHG